MGAPLLLTQLRQFGKSYSDLANLKGPANADEPESYPDVLYDTQPYAQAGSATLTFFASATAANLSDATLSNFPTGILQAGYYFEVHRVHVIIDAMPAALATVAVTGPANDVEILHKTARGTLEFGMKGKRYGPIKLAYFGRPGGPTPFWSTFGTGTIANNSISAGNTESNGGFPYLGNLLIPPMINFRSVMNFNSTAISALTNITVAMLGIMHRPVA